MNDPKIGGRIVSASERGYLMAAVFEIVLFVFLLALTCWILVRLK